MNYSFSVKFKIFYSYPLTKKELNMRERICEDFHSILKTIVSEFSDKYKYLERCEPSISSLDEKKQLRMSFTSMLNQDTTESCYLVFDQKQSYGEYFSLEELKVLVLIMQEVQNMEILHNIILDY